MLFSEVLLAFGTWRLARSRLLCIHLLCLVTITGEQKPCFQLTVNIYFRSCVSPAVAYPGIFFGGGSTNSVEDRGQTEVGSGGDSPLVRGSGGSCNLVQEISFHIVKFFQFLVL